MMMIKKKKHPNTTRGKFTNRKKKEKDKTVIWRKDWNIIYIYI